LGSHGQSLAILLSAVGTFLLSSLGIAGPNRGAALLVHTDDAQEYSLGTDYSHRSGLECPDDYDCPPYDDPICRLNMWNVNPTSHRGSELTVFWVLVAVPEGNPARECPRIQAITFGVEYDDAMMHIVDWGTTAPIELQTEYWPDPGEGTSIAFSSVRPSPIVEAYWFAAFAYEATVFSLKSNPYQGGVVADDAIPANLDTIEFYGKLGFNGAEGTAPGSGGTPVPAVRKSWGAIKSSFH
jgi:hypothetical protein